MKVHFIKKSDESYVMFLCESLKFYNVNVNVKLLVEDILSGTSKENSIEQFHVNEDYYDKILQILRASPVENFTSESENILYKLVLNVTNTCNLSCKYCYADGGNYSCSEGMMDIKTARTAIDLFYSKYRNIKNIQFFGGEPLLNEPVIRFICQYIVDLYNTKKIDSLPNFGVISNGTIFSEKLAETIKKYSISLSFSIDGPQIVHDTLRVDKNGRGSFKCLSENIKKYGMRSVKPIGAEITYSSIHEDQGISVIDAVKYIKNEFGIPNIHVVPVAGREIYELKNRDMFSNCVEEIFSELSNNKNNYTYSLINKVFLSLKNRSANKYICEAGISTFTVSHKGDIYPCFMLNGEHQYIMGNIYSGESVFNEERFLNLRNTLKSFSKYEYEQCKDCFNNRICSGCLGINYFNCGNMNRTSDEDCLMRKKITENVLLELSKQLT